MDRGKGSGLAALGLLLGVSLVASTWIGSRTLLAVKREGQIVEVKGYAERRILSDFALWNATFTARAPDLAGASARLEEQRAEVLAYLERKAVPDPAFELLPVQTAVLFGRDDKGVATHEVEGYALSQQLRVSGQDIDLITRVAKDSLELIRRGVELSSWQPEYLYTRLGELKISMLGEATADARRRAETLAQESGARIGALRWAKQGVFQITPATSTEVSDYGRNDTSSREKSIKAVVTVGYALD